MNKYIIMNKISTICIVILSLMCPFVLQGQKQRASVPLEHGAHRLGIRTDKDMQRWREYGLGQFIHWGVYAIPGGEWNGQKTHYAAEWFRSSGLISTEEYDNLYKQFNPRSFNAKAWARQARQMGAKYLIFTTKHHDGFCLWPSKYTDYTIAATPYKKDIVKEIVEAYTAEGIDVHLYFSIIDWSHPGYQTGMPKDDFLKNNEWAKYNPFKTEADSVRYQSFLQFTRNQLLELLENYPKIKGLWFDGSWDGAWMKNAAWVDALGRELRQMHPGLIIGSRFRADDFGKRHVDTNGDLIDDYDQRFERNLPNSLEEVGGNDWDCVMTIPENQWGYHKDWTLSYVKTPSDLIEMMVKANALNGNFVINFGPDGEGNIRKEETVIAREIGRWMDVNGEAIYGTHNSALEKQDWGYVTQKNEDIYLVVFNKPVNNQVRMKLPRAKGKDTIMVIGEASFLIDGKPAKIKEGLRDKFGNDYYDIVVPENLQKETMPFVIKIKLKEINKGDRKAYQQAII